MVSELGKRFCRYLLHRYLGPFLEEKVALDQLDLRLDKGIGIVTQLTLDAAHLNETLAKYQLPFSVVDGFIGTVTVNLPLALSTAAFSSVFSVSAESLSSLGGLRLELSDVQFTLRGLDMNEVLQTGHSLDLLASSLILSEFASASQSLAVDYTQSVFSTGIALPLEGLDQLASVIDSIVSQIEIVVKELIVRLESPPSLTFLKNSCSLSAIELHLLKACAKFTAKDSTREVDLSLSNIELRAETYKGEEPSESNVDSTYFILLRIPDAKVSLSTSTSTVFTKIIVSSLITFFPGPDVICSLISMLDSIFNNKPPAKQENAALFESLDRDADPVMFESCAASMSIDPFPSSDDPVASSSPSVHLVINIVRATAVIAYQTPQNPQSMSVAFFVSLPTTFGVASSTSRNAYALCCPADCIIVQFLSSKFDIIFNTQQQTFSVLDREDSQSTLKSPTVEWETAAQPLRMSVRLSVDCFDFSDCVRHAENSAFTFTQLLICDDSDDARPALTLDLIARFTGFKEIQLSLNKPCQSEFDLSTVLSRVVPLATSITSFLASQRPVTVQRSPSSATFTCKFEKLRFFVRFPKPQPLSLIAERDEFSLYPETLVLDAERFSIHLTQIAHSQLADISRDFSVDCNLLYGWFQIDPSQVPISIFRMSSLKADLMKRKKVPSDIHSQPQQREPCLFADPPMRLHNGRELHVPTQAQLTQMNDSVTVDISVFNMSLPPAHVLHLLIERISELKSVLDAFTERKKLEQEQKRLMALNSLLLETTGTSIYYSMAQGEPEPFNRQKQSATPAPPLIDVSTIGIRLEKFLVSATALKFEHCDQVHRSDNSKSNALAFVVFDVAAHVAPFAKSGWVRVGSLSLLDALSDHTKPAGNLDFSNFAPVLFSSIQPQSSFTSSSSSSETFSSLSSGTTSKNSYTLFAVWQKRRIAARLNQISLDLCSPPGKIPSCIQIACDIASAFEKEFRSEPPPMATTHISLKPQQKQDSKMDFCLEANGVSIFLRTKTDQDFDALSSMKNNSLPGLCFSFDNIHVDASSTTAIKPAPGNPPIGDLWLGISNSLLELCLRTGEELGDLRAGRRERMFQADWLELTLGLSSARGTTAFVDVSGSSVNISTTVNNLSALCALVATAASGFKSSSISSFSEEEKLSAPQRQTMETPAELKDALTESIPLSESPSREQLGSFPINWPSPSATNSSDDGFEVVPTSLAKQLPKEPKCRKLLTNSVPLNINEKYLEKPLYKPDPLSVQPRGWPTPVFRFTLRDTTIRCALVTDRGDSLELRLTRMAIRYEKCPAWTPNLYRVSASVFDIDVIERHNILGVANSAVICSRLVAEDVPKIHSAPQILAKMAFVRQSSCSAPLLKQNNDVPQDAECDVRISIQPIRINASAKTIEIFRNLTSKFNSVCQLANQPVDAASASRGQSSEVRSPAHHHHHHRHRLVGEAGRGAPVLFDETGEPSTGITAPGGLFIRSFAVQPNVLLEINFSGSISAAAVNVPVGLDKCRLTLPSLMEARNGFKDVGRLLEYAVTQWEKAVPWKSAVVTAGTGLNKLTASAQELAFSAGNLGALLMTPLYSDELPPAMTVDSQLRPGRVLLGITTSAASLSADVVKRLFSVAVPIFQHASSAASTLISGQLDSASGSVGAVVYQRCSSPSELKSQVSTSSSSSSTASTRERKTSQNQNEALRKAASSALLTGQPDTSTG